MRILVGWDDIAEAELIDTFLNVDENTSLGVHRGRRLYSECYVRRI